MNRENLTRLADSMESRAIPLGYCQLTFGSSAKQYPDVSGHPCQTTACLAGQAYALATGHYDPSVVDVSQVAETAQEFLGLNTDERAALFDASPFSDRLFDSVSPEASDKLMRSGVGELSQAVRTLRYAAEHDVVDWEAANPPETWS